MSAIETISSERTHPAGLPRAFLGKLAAALATLVLRRRELRRTRVRLFELSDDELRDIGLTRELADREAARSLLACYMNNSR